MSFINWGNSTPEQRAAQAKLEHDALYEQAVRMSQARNRGNNAMFGGAGGGGTPSQNNLPSNSIEFVLNTAEYLFFELSLEVTDNTTYTVTWGDGVTQDLSLVSNVNNTIDHTYSEPGEYTVRISFADQSLVRELNFEGEDESMATLLSIIGLTNLSNLVEFRADWNQLQTIDFSGLTNLTYVDVSDNKVYNSAGLSSINLAGCTSLEYLYLDDNDFSAGFPDLSGLTSLILIDFDDCGIIGSVDISGLPSLERFDFSQNTDLTNLIISSSQPLGGIGNELLADNCALTQTSVDNILTALAANAVTNGYIDLRFGTNAAPGVPGLTAIAILEAPNPGKNWSVDVNP